MKSRQLDLFADVPARSVSPRPEKLVMDADALVQWKSRIAGYQQSQQQSQPPQQGMLFDLAPIHCAPDSIDPFSLRLQPSQFYRMPEQGYSIHIYFVIDRLLTRNAGSGGVSRLRSEIM